MDLAGTPLEPLLHRVGRRGQTFAAPVTILKESYLTDAMLSRWPYGTDYLSLASSPDGNFHLLWVDTRDGKGEIQTAKIEIHA